MSQPQHNRLWIWFFVVLAILGIASISISWIYNVNQQLTLDDLARQRALWEAHRPSNYVFAYTKRLNDHKETYVVTVRNGQVQSVTMQPADTAPAILLRPDQFSSYDMAGQFDMMQRFLELDHESGRPRGYSRAEFDPNDGHFLRYVHRDGVSRKQVVLQLTRFEVGAP